MDDAKREFVRTWLVKAQHDLAAAGKLSVEPDAYLDVAIFHCQQAAEKAVKAFLVFHDKRFEKTHDIAILIALAVSFEPAFSSWLEAANRLTPYATGYRYPDEMLEPTREEFAQAAEAAQGLFSFVLSLLPRAAHP